MLGEIKEVEVGKITVYKKKNGKPTKEIEEVIPGKMYELRKQGVNTSLEIRSVFLELVMKINAVGKKLTDEQFGAAMVLGMRGPIVADVQRIIQSCVFVPKMTEANYNKLDTDGVMQLFSEIYHFHITEAEKKSKTPKSSKTGTTKKKK